MHYKNMVLSFTPGIISPLMPQNTDDPLTMPMVLLWLLAGGVLFYLQVLRSETPFTKKNLKRYLFLRTLEEEYKPFLKEYFPFYNSLNDRDKLRFERRVQRFIDMKEFVPRGVAEVTTEMKALIAGSAIQLTSGYPDIYFRHFWRILIYSDSYYSNITHRYHKGEVNPGGIIVLSWKNFLEGFKNPSDGINLGFHEMAHALKLSNIIDDEEYNFYDRQIMNDLEKEARKEAERIRINNAPSLFRNYYINNMDEFFAVAVECFFERPFELNASNPVIYKLLTNILILDPVVIYSRAKPDNTIS